ncbi:NADPH-dependent glutamate synthase beta subunit-like oxidoreductase [Nitrosospira sp. Nsp5]|uniref:NADPH-dependent glutamate synthase beta chain n=1 Tax=Nitrosospira multiformis TaxID=1231 RepID=A0ABY0TBS5_9PROT|nr:MULTISPECIES: FAD-dependent oxidoreductase [Nitrosospira]PTR06346.1 NADPH-dependent glutamate synthase beta subunit-like oxidoreductase [Nitrosospira sp. Nsp5]SDQ59204.1 NADPH-dependent glutamate synthase beta chain [Nitrosospira multiformis]
MMTSLQSALHIEPATAVFPVLGFEMTFADLYRRDGLVRLDQAFLDFLHEGEPGLRVRLDLARANPDGLDRKDEAALLIEVAPWMEDFVARLFGIEKEVGALAARHHQLAPLYACKRQFVQRRATNKVSEAEAAAVDGVALEGKLVAEFEEPFSELVFATKVIEWLLDENVNEERLRMALLYAAWALKTAPGRERNQDGILFKAPAKLDYLHLLSTDADTTAGYTVHRLHHIRRREGFALTDSGTDLAGALDEANYCIWCHEQGKDSCSKGLKEKPKTPGEAPSFKKSQLGVLLAGCPLEERISEFHKLKTQGLAVSGLAMIVVDNPMCAGTGHRICNDCMKSCIYQKQEPVDIPQAETRTLKDVLELPWGFEIYSLLTRWNPLNLRRPVPKAPTGRKVLVVGMGPAGYTLAHHLMNDGHTVVGIDGLKIEPLAPELSGVNSQGEHVSFNAIRDAGELEENLDERMPGGFGGVAEYGITVRWNKNFLKLIRLLLERREEFALFGGVRFGGTLTADDALAIGFDHVALAAGAGRPTVLDMPNGLARGVRAASDFLMALQLSGAAQTSSVANMQLRLPVVVIGGGLTAIDTATEALAYYPVQVDKFLRRYEILTAVQGETAIRGAWDEEEREIAEEFLSHGRAIRAERKEAEREGRAPRVLELLQSWGGATIAYRKRLIDSPSYTLNHEEVEKALEEGIWFAEGLTPVRVEADKWEHARSVKFSVQILDETGSWQKTGQAELPARAVLVAAGTQPNTVLAREDEKNFKLNGRYFAACDENGDPVSPPRGNPKPDTSMVLLSRCEDGRFISFFGDLHPSYSGNVVKAMSSAKQGYPVVSRMLGRVAPASAKSARLFFAELNGRLRAIVHKVERLTPNIIEVVVHAPMAVERFHPGQFYRFQNFATLATAVGDTKLAMEGIALTGASVDVSRGLVSLIALEMGGSADLCAKLNPGDPVVLMGPTGTPTEILPEETVVLVGGGLGNAVLFSIGAAARAAGSKILYFAGYKKLIDRYKVAEIEAAADVVVWCCDEAPGFTPSRPDDLSYAGNIVDAMAAYGSGALGPQKILLSDADRIIAIGSDRMMAAVGAARHNKLQPYLKTDHYAIGSINSPMQCMMKEICAQCLQPHKDPETGEITYVFSCFNQDQPLDQVDFGGLASRLRQNSVQEKLTTRWISHCLKETNKVGA